MEEVKITVIGAGVIGLSIASELSNAYDDVFVLDKNETFGQETSSRNSEVIHSGIYYEQNSLKALLCVEGAGLLYELCKKNSINYKKVGKLVLATEQSEIKKIEKLFGKGRNNNVNGLQILSGKELSRFEYEINAVAALYSPNTGIIDSHLLMKYFYNQAKNNGVLFSFDSEVTSLDRRGDSFIVGIKKENYAFKTQIVINCAGLFSDRVAELAGINIDAAGYRLKFCKGTYFSYQNPSPVSMLIYPVPHEELVGLGVHATLDIGGRLRFGPDTEYIETIDYRIDANKQDLFYRSASKIINGLDKNAFMPDMAGIRPKLQGPGEKVRDFVIADETDKGLAGLINLIGIESPGLTASIAIAKKVVTMVKTIVD
ncbi:MAG: NAD(P)/FAD-dependent oxidoreductase [Nitrospirota bacterium]